MLCQAAWAAIKSNKTRLSAFYYRLVRRRGPKKANLALAHLMLRIIFVMLQTGVPYVELGTDYLPKKERDVDYWVRKIRDLGYDVKVQEMEETA